MPRGEKWHSGTANLGTLVENCEVPPFSLVLFFSHGETAKEIDFNLQLKSQIVLWTLGKSQIANNNNKKVGTQNPFNCDINFEEPVLQPVVTTIMKSNESQMLRKDKLQFSVKRHIASFQLGKKINHN